MTTILIHEIVIFCVFIHGHGKFIPGYWVTKTLTTFIQIIALEV